MSERIRGYEDGPQLQRAREALEGLPALKVPERPEQPGSPVIDEALRDLEEQIERVWRKQALRQPQRPIGGEAEAIGDSDRSGAPEPAPGS